MATIKDVAARAGVSEKTVSRVMKNYQHISADTRSKVEKAMLALSYAPMSFERNVRFGDTRGIGMLFGDPSSGYQSRLNHALLDACEKADRYLATAVFDETRPDWSAQLSRFLDRTRVQNVILLPPLCDSKDLHDLLIERQVNFVLVAPSSPVAGASCIAMDDRQASFEIVNYFIELGHTRIGHITGRANHIATLLRRKGYEEALLKAGLERRADYCVEGNFEFSTALQQADKLFRMKDRPTALFAANDEMAAAVIMAANRLGLWVPEDVSVAGFDDAPIARTVCPEITTIAQPFDDLAAMAIDSMRTLVPARTMISETKILAHTLVRRGSVGPAPDG